MFLRANLNSEYFDIPHESTGNELKVVSYVIGIHKKLNNGGCTANERSRADISLHSK